MFTWEIGEFEVGAVQAVTVRSLQGFPGFRINLPDGKISAGPQPCCYGPVTNRTIGRQI